MAGKEMNFYEMSLIQSHLALQDVKERLIQPRQTKENVLKEIEKKEKEENDLMQKIDYFTKILKKKVDVTDYSQSMALEQMTHLQK